MDLLSIYLNDHLAASAGGVALARRARDSQRDRNPRLALFLDGIVEDIAADKTELEEVIASLGHRRDPVRQVVAQVGERLGRLKPNGRVLRRSPLSDLVELEALAIAVQGKRCLWRTLQQLDDRRLASVDLQRLVDRAEDQHDRIEAQRTAIAPRAVAGHSGPVPA
ncbi:MAG: hypothetical protein AB7G37_02290 [Solirubrobacteraceae bacterium]